MPGTIELRITDASSLKGFASSMIAASENWAASSWDTKV